VGRTRTFDLIAMSGWVYAVRSDLGRICPGKGEITESLVEICGNPVRGRLNGTAARFGDN
jgi:hypothetical protein